MSILCRVEVQLMNSTETIHWWVRGMETRRWCWLSLTSFSPIHFLSFPGELHSQGEEWVPGESNTAPCSPDLREETMHLRSEQEWPQILPRIFLLVVYREELPILRAARVKIQLWNLDSLGPPVRNAARWLVSHGYGASHPNN